MRTPKSRQGCDRQIAALIRSYKRDFAGGGAFGYDMPTFAANSRERYDQVIALQALRDTLPDRQAKPETFMMDVEYTDTFGGEANYCWVKRSEIEVPVGASDALIIRRAKKAVGLSGVRGVLTEYGDTFDFRPARSCTVMFVTTRYTAGPLTRSWWGDK